MNLVVVYSIFLVFPIVMAHCILRKQVLRFGFGGSGSAYQKSSHTKIMEYSLYSCVYIYIYISYMTLCIHINTNTYKYACYALLVPWRLLSISNRWLWTHSEHSLLNLRLSTYLQTRWGPGSGPPPSKGPSHFKHLKDMEVVPPFFVVFSISTNIEKIL